MKKGWKRVGAVVLTASMLVTAASAAAQYGAVDPNDPYAPPVSGMFHEQKINSDGLVGQYSVYIPENFEPCTDGVMILTPDGMTAKSFVESEEGQAWKALSDELGIATVYVEPQNGQTWNLDLSDDDRDDQAFLKKVYDTIRSKSQTLDAPFDMDERAFYLVGYEEGGASAHEFAMAWPAIFAGAASVGGSAVPESAIDTLGDALSYPFAEAENLVGQQENAIPNCDVPVPMWIVESEDEADNSDAVEAYWATANDAEQTSANSYAQTVYVSEENDRQRVWVTDGAKADEMTPEVLYEEFLSKVQRFVGDPEGRLEWTVEHANDGKTGFFTYEQMIDGKQRRWMVYVPSSYNSSEAVPLVVATHGYSSAMTAFTGDSRWQDVAEENGFIVVFTQGYPTDGVMGNIPVPYWNNPLMGLTVEEPVDELSYFRQVVAQVKEGYTIDATRVYATGHSNGSCMTWLLALEESDLFTAFAPIGSNMGAYYETVKMNDVAVPVWNMKGEYDNEDGASLAEGTLSHDTISYWTQANGVSATAVEQTDETGRYVTQEYQDVDGVPLVRFTEVKNSPHAYLPAQAEMIWEDFFSKYSKKDGVLYYEGKAVATPEAALSEFTDIDGHWAQDAIEQGVKQGLFSGTSATQFSPEQSVDRAMAVTVLGRSVGTAGNASAAAAYTDVSADAYYAPYVGWATQQSITNGTSQTTFGPTEKVTREQLAVMLSAYVKVQGKTLPAANETAAYADDASISSWAKDAVAQMQTSGIMTGKENNQFDPVGAVTRAELAVVMQRIAAL